MIDAVRRGRRKWFPTAEEEAQERERAEKAANAVKEQIRTALGLRYIQDFRQWLQDEAIRHDPKPGEPAIMSYQCGVRDGIRLVSAYLNAAERSASERE